jgi:Putative prokaryotic signal transducing protein
MHGPLPMSIAFQIQCCKLESFIRERQLTRILLQSALATVTKDSSPPDQQETTMFCPNCQTEYKDHVMLCADCHEVLISESQLLQNKSPQTNIEDLDLVQVLSTHDLPLVELAKSMLDEAGIPVMVRNEKLQDLFGIGRLTFNPVSGDVDFFVNAEDHEAAREILATIKAETNS